ncbi:putative MHCK/EF2 kinase, protein kinase-like domain superfamily [Plasmopara halstedii]
MQSKLSISVTSPRSSQVRVPSLSPRSVSSSSSNFVVPSGQTLRSTTFKHPWRSITFDQTEENLSSRRRFHSSDVVLRSNRSALLKLRPLYHQEDNNWNSNGNGFYDSSRFKHMNENGEDEPEPPLNDPVEFSLRRRTCSENFTKSSRAPSSFVPLRGVRYGFGEEEQKIDEKDVDNLQALYHGNWKERSDDNYFGLWSSRINHTEFCNDFASTSDFNVESESQTLGKLRNLLKLYQEGFITVTEYKDRRVQLVDELSEADQTIIKTSDLLSWELPILYHEPPEFSLLRERSAIKHIFDSSERKWKSSQIQVKIDTKPFSSGGLRQVFHLQDLSMLPPLLTVRDTDEDNMLSKCTSYVAKIAINPNENPDTYFKDVEMQAVAAKYAKLYNSYNPPRRVEFLDAWILQLIPVDASDQVIENLTLSGTICGVEPFIAGEYHKHNNNFGYVSDFERNTPQAFSHFTYEASGQEILVVDIQGVGDHYTDPQIHTRRGKEFGKGNLALRGFQRFLGSHRCNPICRYLKLPLINPKDEGSKAVDRMGTIPAQTYMNQPRVVVDQVDSVLCHYYGESMAFKMYTTRKKRERKRRKTPGRRGRQKWQEEENNLMSSACSEKTVDIHKVDERFVMALADQQRSCSTLICDGISACVVS